MYQGRRVHFIRCQATFRFRVFFFIKIPVKKNCSFVDSVQFLVALVNSKFFFCFENCLYVIKMLMIFALSLLR